MVNSAELFTAWRLFVAELLQRAGAPEQIWVPAAQEHTRLGWESLLCAGTTQTSGGMC